MPNITAEGKRRLAVIEYLFNEISKTYPGPANIALISDETGIPRTNLHKWIKKEVNPREATFRAAVEAMEGLLEERQGLPQGTVQNACAELYRQSEAHRDNPDRPVFTLTKAEVRIFITVLAGFTVGSLITTFFLVL